MHTSKIGQRQVSLLQAAAAEPEGVLFRGFAQRGWRSYARLIEEGLLQWNYGHLQITAKGEVELMRALRRQERRAQIRAAEEAARARDEDKEYEREARELGSW